MIGIGPVGAAGDGVRTKVRMLGLIAAPLFMAQCAPACVPGPPPPRSPPVQPAPAVFGCVDGSDVNWWLNASGVVPGTREPLLGDQVTASVDGVRFSDPLTIGYHPDLSTAHYQGTIDAAAGADVDLTVTGPDGIVDVRADDLEACPVAEVELSRAAIDCSGTLSVTMALTVDGGQFSPPPQARVDVWAQLDAPSSDPARRTVRLVDPSAGLLSSGVTRDLTATGLTTAEPWTVWAFSRPVALNGIEGGPGTATDWPPLLQTGVVVVPDVC